MRRVAVVGTSGSGKSTFARALAERMGVPFTELDSLHHGPGWTEASPEELRARVEAAMADLRRLGVRRQLRDEARRSRLGAPPTRSSGSTCRCACPCAGSGAQRRGGSAPARSSGTATASRGGARSGAASRCSPGRCGRTSAGGANGRSARRGSASCASGRRGRCRRFWTASPRAELRQPRQRPQAKPDRREDHVEEQVADREQEPPQKPPSERYRRSLFHEVTSARRLATMRMMRCAVSSIEASEISNTGQPSRRWTAAACSSSS